MIREELLAEAQSMENFKKLARVIIDKKGNFTTKDFDDLKIPFETFLRMARIDKNVLIKNAEKLLKMENK